MKPVTNVLSIGISIFIFTGCGNPAGSGGSIDSSAVANAYTHDHPEVDRGAATTKLFEFSGSGISQARVIMSEDSCDDMQRAYINDPVDLENTSGVKLTGFVMDPADFPDLISNSNNLSTIGFHLGIRNFGTYGKNGEKPIYTMVIVPVGKNMQPYPVLKRSVAKKGSPAPRSDSYGYDFVDPCPGSPGCPIIKP